MHESDKAFVVMNLTIRGCIEFVRGVSDFTKRGTITKNSSIEIFILLSLC